MQKPNSLYFPCLACKKEVSFSLFSLNNQPKVQCPTCGKHYIFDDPTLLSHLEKFITLSKTLRECQDILSDINVGVDVDGKTVLIPYKILLTRLSSQIDLRMGEETMSIAFRHEPAVNSHELSKP